MVVAVGRSTQVEGRSNPTPNVGTAWPVNVAGVEDDSHSLVAPFGLISSMVSCTRASYFSSVRSSRDRRSAAVENRTNLRVSLFGTSAGERKLPAMGNPGATLSAYRDMRSQHEVIL